MIKLFIILISLAIPLSLSGTEHRIQVYYSESPPYSYSSEYGSRGFLIEYVEELFNELNLTYDLHSMSWSEAISSAAKDSKGIFIAGILSDDRKRDFKATDPIYAVTHEFYAKKDFNVRYTGNLYSLKGYKIGVIKGWSYDESFTEATYLTRTEYIDSTLGLIALFTGEIDILATEHLLAEYILTYHLSTIKYEISSIGDISSDWLRVLVNKKLNSRDFSLEKFNKVLSDAESSGKLEQYMEKYLVTRN
jgi:polar amino acid transport system substrate-binding protein